MATTHVKEYLLLTDRDLLTPRRLMKVLWICAAIVCFAAAPVHAGTDDTAWTLSATDGTTCDATCAGLGAAYACIVERMRLVSTTARITSVFEALKADNQSPPLMSGTLAHGSSQAPAFNTNGNYYYNTAYTTTCSSSDPICTTSSLTEHLSSSKPRPTSPATWTAASASVLALTSVTMGSHCPTGTGH